MTNSLTEPILDETVMKFRFIESNSKLGHNYPMYRLKNYPRPIGCQSCVNYVDHYYWRYLSENCRPIVDLERELCV